MKKRPVRDKIFYILQIPRTHPTHWMADATTSGIYSLEALCDPMDGYRVFASPRPQTLWLSRQFQGA